MSNDNNSLEKGSVLGRRIRGMARAGKKIYSPGKWVPKKDKSYAILLTSNDEKHSFMTLMIHIGRLQLRFLLPKLLKPFKASVYTDLKGFNRKVWVYRYAPKIYGIGYLPKERVFHIFHGVNSGNSRGFPRDELTIWIPSWSRYRLIRHSIKDKNNNTFWESAPLTVGSGRSPEPTDIIGGLCPKLRFECVTEDNKRVLGSAFIEEREWYKGVTVFGRPLLKKSVKLKRLLKVHLQVNSPDENGKPHSLQYDFIVTPNETIREAIRRFCESKIFKRDKILRLHLEYIEPEVI